MAGSTVLYLPANSRLFQIQFSSDQPKIFTASLPGNILDVTVIFESDPLIGEGPGQHSVSRDRLRVSLVPSSAGTANKAPLFSLCEAAWIAVYWYFQSTINRSPVVRDGKPVPEQCVELTLKCDQFELSCPEVIARLELLGLLDIENLNGKQIYVVYATAFWQLAPELFVGTSTSHQFLRSKPLRYTITSTGIRHPKRPLPPSEKLPFYQRHCLSNKLNSVFKLRPVSMSDLDLIHKWMNNPRVSEFWGEQGPIEHQKKFLESCLASQHSFTAVGSWNDLDTNGELTTWRDACFFDIYWVKEDRLSSYANGVQDWDRGVHLLVGEDWARGRSTAWLDSIIHYMFLDDPRTQSIYLEPRVDNERFINLLLRYGFHKVKDFAFPHKQAALMKLDRDCWKGCSS